MAKETHSYKWMTIAQVAAHFCVEETSVRRGRGAFARLRQVKLGAGPKARILIPRADKGRQL